jgi:hypothetical protein
MPISLNVFRFNFNNCEKDKDATDSAISSDTSICSIILLGCENKKLNTETEYKNKREKIKRKKKKK